MNTIKFASRESFIEALEARRKFWHDYDVRREKEHKAAEKAWTAEMKRKLREALTWDYERFKKHDGYIGVRNLPQCPVLMEHKLDTVLASLHVTEAKTFTLDNTHSNAWSTAHQLLTWEPDAKTSVC